MSPYLKSLAIFLLIIQTAKAQEYCFENKGLKGSTLVSFSIKANLITEGEWEFGDYSGTTSAEVYAFKGKRIKNKLHVTFLKTVPEGLPNDAKDQVWTLEKGALRIVMYGKNYETNKFETYAVEFAVCVSVKADDYENSLQETYPCDCDAYVIDTDKNGLNVREKGDKQSTIVSKIPFDVDGTMVHLKRSSTSGWLTVSEATNMDNRVVLKKEGFVFAQKLGVSIAGYQLGKADIFERPTMQSRVVHTFLSGTDVIILDCKGKWLKVQHPQMKVSGWLRPEDQCPNPATTCN
jgi:hypothetical protein